jgi:hypothetical protein
VPSAKSSYLQPARLPLQELHFTATANSFFTILVFNDLLRGSEQGSIALVPAAGVNYPVVAGIGDAGVTAPGYSLQHLVIEKLPSDAPFDLAVRDAKTGFTFFNIEGHQYDYEAKRRIAQHSKRATPDFKGICQRGRQAGGRRR